MVKSFPLLLLFFCFRSIAQPLHPVKTDTWKGFKRTWITIDHHAAYYVSPKIPLAGNPWVWRASFPDWHTEMDSLLLARGVYLAFISVDDQYGSPAALVKWDSFYDYLINKLHFSPRPALEAVSRGALYAVGWAKRNPDKVSCIYAETPVYDIRSWPGGKGKGTGDTAAWRQLKAVYHLTEEQALNYQDNPADHLEGLASFKVPVLNVVGIHDRVAPYEENTGLFVNRYTGAGGPVIIYPVTEGPQELQGHHFPLKHPELFADFIYSNLFPVKSMLPYARFFKVRGGIDDFYRAVTKNRRATVAFLGGSITYNPGWRQMVCAYLRERFPQTDFHFISAGIPSLGSLPHAFRLQRDVLDSGKIDLMFVEAAVNDRVNGTDSLTQVRDLEGIVRHAKKSNPAINLMMMEFADPDKTSDYNKGITPAEIINHELIAEHYGLPSLNMAEEVRDKLRHHEFSWTDDFKDLHPAVFGQELYFENIKALLDSCFEKIGKGENPGIIQRSLPASLDKASFTQGSYVDIRQAACDSGWTLYRNWTPEDNLGTREGFVHVPVLSSDKPGSTLTLSFKGNAVGVAVVSGGDAGTIRYAIDGAPVQTLDLFTPWSSGLHLPWYLLLGSNLGHGKHTLRIIISDQKNRNSKGNACRIVYFFKNG